MSVVVSQTVFEEGKAAKAGGQDFTSDPYRAGSQESADWLAGYTADEPEVSMTGSNGDGRSYDVSANTHRPV